MSITGWIVIGILGADVLFFGTLALWFWFERRRMK